MNIFETQAGFTGRFDSDSTGGSLMSILTLAREIRLKLGKQGYLLDNYLSVFLEGVNVILAHDAAGEGFEHAGQELRNLCFDVIDQNDKRKEHPFYVSAIRLRLKQPELLHYQERYTKMNMLYAILFDEFLNYAVKSFLKEKEKDIYEACGGDKMTDLFGRITEVIGEPIMETLNLRLKQRFLTVPLVTVFVQGLTNDLVYSLQKRDGKTSKQIFQLLMDSMPDGKEGV